MTCQGNVLRDRSSEDDRQPPHDEAGHGADSGKSGGRPRVWPCRTAETGGRGALCPASGHATKETKIAEFRSRGRSRHPRLLPAPGGSARRWVVKKRIRNAVSARRPFPLQPRGRGRLRADAGQTLMHQGGEPWAPRPGTERDPPTEQTSPAPRSAAPLGFVPRALLVLRRDFITPAAL